MTRTRIGPYRIVGELGHGGMGIVYKAVHEETGHLAAVKTVNGLRGARLAGLRAEIQALVRVRHPGIVHIIQEGLQEGVPWYAMELLEGRTLKEYIAELWGAMRATGRTITEPSTIMSAVLTEETMLGSTEEFCSAPSGAAPRSSEDLRLPAAAGRLPALIHLFRQICLPVSFMHSLGLLHCDLKPANIFIRSDGQPVIMDFGLAAYVQDPSGRAVMEPGSMHNGTPEYMSPEQIRGDLSDARSDLYSLGVILYEAITGRLPFRTSSEGDVIWQHLARLPPPPSEFVRELPPALEALVLRLLVKEPRGRFGHAADVAHILAELEPGAPAVEATGARDYLYRPKLVGRKEILTELAAHMDLTLRGTGGFVLLSGDSGMGKTSVALAVAREAVARHMKVATAECVSIGPLDSARGIRNAPLHPFRRHLQALADWCMEQGAEATERVLGRRGAILRPYEPLLRFLPGQDAHPNAPELPAQASRRRLMRALQETLLAFARERPLLLIVDDLQWADELSLGFLMSMSPAFFARCPLLILGIYRTGVVSEPLQEVIDRPWIRRLEIGPLDEDSVSALVADMLAMPAPPEPLVQALTRRSMGNPFFVGEYLRTAVSERLLYRGQGTWRLAGHVAGVNAIAQVLPDTLVQLIKRRLQGLEEDARRLLEAAAVLGREVEQDLLFEVADLPRERSLVAVDALTVHNVMEKAPPDRLRFLHDKLREVTYDSLSDRARQQLHTAAATTLERRFAGTPHFPFMSAEMAYHLIKADSLMKSLHYLTLASEQSLRNFANREAVRYFAETLMLDQRLGHPAPVLQRAQWLRQIANAYEGLGLHRESEERLYLAVALLGWPVPRSRPALVFGVLVQAARQAIHLLHGPRLRPDPAAQRAAEREAARSYDLLMRTLFYRSGDTLRILFCSISTLNLADLAMSPPEMAEAYANGQYVAGILPWPWLARRYGYRARQALALVNDPVVSSWVDLMACCHAIGAAAWEQAFAAGERSAEVAERVGFERRWEEAQGMLSTAHFLHGDYELATLTSEQRIEQAALRGDAQSQVWAASGMAQACIQMGMLEQGLQLAQHAERCLSEQLGRNDKIRVYGALALAYLRIGDRAQALRATEQGSVEIRKGRPNQYYCINAYTWIAETLIDLWATAQPDDTPGASELATRAWLACCDVAASARIFPVHRPRALLVEARYHHVRGDRAQVLSLCARALEAARSMNLVYEEALAEILWAQQHASGTPERAARLRQAHRLLQSLKAAHDLSHVEALAEAK